MNKTEVNQLLPKAYEVLKITGIADNDDKIIKTYRGYISTFGAAVSGGSLLAAIAYFSDHNQGETGCDRTKLMKAIYLLINPNADTRKEVGESTLFEYVKKNIMRNAQIEVKQEAAWKEKVIDAAIALKLAMNLYKLG